MRASEFVTEAPRDVFHFVGHSPAVPRPTGNYYKWRVSLSNGQYYHVRAGAHTDLSKFQQYFTRKWGAEMPDVEAVKAERLERLSEQDVDEMAGEIHGGVRKALMDKGYKYLGSGIDKQAYLEPGTGQVLIIFGYRKGQKDFSPDQRMFINWINYCNKNQSNPHLPKFSGFESFKFQGKNYIQARMEPLQELPDEIGYLVGHADEVIKKRKTDYKKELKTMSQYAMHTFNDEGGGTWYELKDVVKHLGGKKAAANLLNTVYDVKRFGRKQGYSIDLHKGNYMQRANGTIVVNDPFVLWLRGMLD